MGKNVIDDLQVVECICGNGSGDPCLPGQRSSTKASKQGKRARAATRGTSVVCSRRSAPRRLFLVVWDTTSIRCACCPGEVLLGFWKPGELAICRRSKTSLLRVDGGMPTQQGRCGREDPASGWDASRTVVLSLRAVQRRRWPGAAAKRDRRTREFGREGARQAVSEWKR